jgi:hypothetical protein
MNPLQSRLAALRRRLRFVVLWRGLTGLAGLLLACSVLAGVLDWGLHLPALVRGILLVGTMTGAAVVGYVYLLAPLRAKVDDLSLALKVEDYYPILNDALASTVQFLEQPGAGETAGSGALRHEAVKRALRMAQGCNFNDVVDGRGTYWTGCGALASATLALTLFFFFPSLAQTALWRFLEPFGDHSWTQVTIEGCPHRVAVGMPYVIKGQVEGIVPADAKIEVESRAPEDPDGLAKTDRLVVPIKQDAQAQAARFETALDMTQQRSKFRFRIRAYDAVYPPRGWHEVEVVPPPQLAMLDGLPSPQIELHYPAYTDLPSPDKLSPGVQHVDAVAGTLVKLRAAVDRPIAKAWIEYRPDNPQAKLALALAPVGFAGCLESYAATVGGHAVWGTIPAHIEADGMRLDVEFMPWVNGLYVLHLEDSEGIGHGYEWRLNVLADPLPVVNLERPASNQDLLPDAEITLQASAADEKYAVRSVYLEYRLREGEGKWVDSGPNRLPFYDYPGKGAKQQRVPVERRWSLKGLAKPGQILVIQACADDFNNVVPFRQAGRSHEIELRIVSKGELAKKQDETLHQIQQEIVRLQQMQSEALEKLKDIKAKKDKPGTRLNQELVEVEEKQKQIQARIGANPEEGLRAELKRMKETMRDNKLPPSDASARLKRLDAELERIMQQDLQQIEPNLVEARKEVSAETKPKETGKDKQAKEDKQVKENQVKENQAKENQAKQKQAKEKQKEKGPLEKALKHQESAKNALDELVKYMTPWAGLQQVKGDARKLQEKQQDLRKAAEGLADKKIALEKEKADLDKQKNNLTDQPKNNPEQRAEQKKLAQKEQEIKDAQEQLKKDLAKLADPQNDLAQQADQLLRTMEEAQKKQTEQGNAKTAELLREAHDIANKGLLPEKMREAEKQLREQKPHEAVEKQKESMENLDKVIGALEERREDQIAKLMQNQRKEEVKLEKLRKDQDLLQKKVREEKKAIDELAKKKKIVEDKLEKKQGDPEKLRAEKEDLEKKIQERKRTLERLAEEQRKLQKDLKNEARELAKQQAEQAGKELDRAGDALERAADQMENGEDPEEAFEQAKEHLEKAQAKLQEAQDELAREQLARIADHLKGLKERQDRTIEESVRMHKAAIEEKKHWTDPLLKSLKNNARRQKAIGQETDSLKDKLKGAKVFEHVLVRAAKAMDEAAKSMEKRWDNGNLRLEALEKEEMAAELKAQEETLRWQNEAGRRLTRLLDSIKNEPVAKRQRKKEKKDEKNPENPDEEKGGIRPGDGIPSVAQLKVLRDEQREVLERTKDFAKRHPAFPMVDEGQRERMAEIQAELADIQAEQAVIQRLFEEITQQPAEKKGENP